MVVQAGLRERKKLQTRQAIFDAARKLFAARGFDHVTVAEVAREANVSEVTVFNYFPCKEDLFYGGMQFFEEELLQAVRTRPRGEAPVRTLRRRLLQGTAGLNSKERIEAVIRARELVSASPSLVAREREIMDRYTRELADILATDTRADATDSEPLALASALIGAHRAIVVHVREQVAAGLREKALVEDTRSQVRRVFGRLERGLGAYAVRR